MRSYGPSMTSSPISRRAGTLCIAGALTILAASIAAGIVDASSVVSHHLFRYPFTHGAFVVFNLYVAVAMGVLCAGVLALRGDDLIAGSGRTATAGVGCVAAGVGLLAVLQLVSIALVDQPTSSTSSSIVDAAFGLASLLVTGGMLTAGVAVSRRARWAGRLRHAPLACGLLSLAVIPIQFTDVIWAGVALFATGYLILGAAMLTESHGAPAPAAAT